MCLWYIIITFLLGNWHICISYLNDFTSTYFLCTLPSPLIPRYQPCFPGNLHNNLRCIPNEKSQCIDFWISSSLFLPPHGPSVFVNKCTEKEMEKSKLFRNDRSYHLWVPRHIEHLGASVLAALSLCQVHTAQLTDLKRISGLGAFSGR